MAKATPHCRGAPAAVCGLRQEKIHAAKAPKVHKLRDNVSILEGSGGNIAVLTGADGKVFVDAGITASRPRILEAANGLSRDPIRYLINTHWHFDHTDDDRKRSLALTIFLSQHECTLHR